MEIKDKKLTFSEKLKRGHFLYFGYYFFYTKYMDKRIAGQSLQGFVCNPGDEIFPVQSITYRMLHCLEKVIRISPDDVFVDIGCGWGRLIGYLNEKKIGGKEMYGVDINRSATEVSAKIFKDRPHIHIICADARECYIPESTVLFMYNPFGESILASFLDMLEQKSGHSIRLYYLHAVYENVFEKRKDRWKLLSRQMLCPKHHIPVVLCEYELTVNDRGVNG